MLKKILIGLAALLVVAGVAIGITLYVTRAPEPGEFYDPPEIAADSAPGTLLRSERFTPDGLPEGAEAWRILYVTEGADGAPVPVSGMVFTGAAAREAAGPRPVIAWGHGAIGVARGCAPSLLEEPGVVVGPLDAALDQGWVVVATDYPGLGAPGFHPFLISDETGRSVLDAVRAARQSDAGVEVGNRYALWGESQGGHAVLSAAQLATEGYAPDLDLVGVAAGAPATDLAPLMTAALTRPAGKVLASQAVAQWTTAYPELSFDEAITPVAAAAGARDRAALHLPELLRGGGADGPAAEEAAADRHRGRPALGAAAGREHPVAAHRRAGAARAGPGRRGG